MVWQLDMRFLYFCLMIGVTSAGSCTTNAAPIGPSVSSDNATRSNLMKDAEALQLEIEKFEQFEEAALSGDDDAFLTQSPKFLTHPLYPYAKATYLQQTLSIDKRTVINEFLSEYPKAPFSYALKSKWFHYLASNKFENAFMQAYRFGTSTKLDCQYLNIQLRRGRDITELDADIADIWLTGRSLPKQCDRLLSLWRKADLLTDERRLMRVKLAVQSKNRQLAQYLKAQLSGETLRLADMWLAAFKNPNVVLSNDFWSAYSEEEFELLQVVSGKLVFANTEGFLDWWSNVGKTNFKQNSSTIDKKLAIALAVNGSSLALDALTQLPSTEIDDGVKQWMLASAIRTQNWQILIDTIDLLPEHYHVDPGVVFWRARADVELHQSAWGQFTLNELAERRDYYGFMAARYLGLEVNVRHEPLQIDDDEIKRLSSGQTYQRALTLFKYGRFLEARKEWNVVISESEPETLEVLAVHAAQSGWYDRPIFTLSKVGYLNDVDLRFPLAYQDAIVKVANKESIPASLIYAVARRESSFVTDAYSRAGAAGLMQLKPSTASYVAKRRVSKTQLFQPQRNIELGARYLSNLLNKTNDHPVLMLAAYNAGLHKVERWLPDGNMSADAWIETIPYKETRNYIKAIYAYDQVYQDRLGVTGSLFADLTKLQVKPEI